MVVALAVDGVIALVTAGGDDGLIPHFQGVHNLGGGLGIGVLDADQPGGLPSSAGSPAVHTFPPALMTNDSKPASVSSCFTSWQA